MIGRKRKLETTYDEWGVRKRKKINLDELKTDSKILSLDQCYFSIDEFKILCDKIAANKKLEILELYDCGIDDERLHMLGDVIVPNTTIKDLDLFGNHITHEGAHSFTNRMVENTTLCTIDFDMNDFIENV